MWGKIPPHLWGAGGGKLMLQERNDWNDSLFVVFNIYQSLWLLL